MLQQVWACVGELVSARLQSRQKLFEAHGLSFEILFLAQAGFVAIRNAPAAIFRDLRCHVPVVRRDYEVGVPVVVVLVEVVIDLCDLSAGQKGTSFVY